MRKQGRRSGVWTLHFMWELLSLCRGICEVVAPEVMVSFLFQEKIGNVCLYDSKVKKQQNVSIAVWMEIWNESLFWELIISYQIKNEGQEISILVLWKGNLKPSQVTCIFGSSPTHPLTCPNLRSLVNDLCKVSVAKYLEELSGTSVKRISIVHEHYYTVKKPETLYLWQPLLPITGQASQILVSLLVWFKLNEVFLGEFVPSFLLGVHKQVKQLSEFVLEPCMMVTHYCEPTLSQWDQSSGMMKLLLGKSLCLNFLM